MLWLKSKTQLTIIPNEALVMNEIKAPNLKIRLKLKMTRLGNWRKHYSTLYNYRSLKCLTGHTSLSHVVGVEVLQILFLLSCAGGRISQYACVVATAILYKSQ